MLKNRIKSLIDSFFQIVIALALVAYASAQYGHEFGGEYGGQISSYGGEEHGHEEYNVS